jgi:hypothetical protein
LLRAHTALPAVEIREARVRAELAGLAHAEAVAAVAAAGVEEAGAAARVESAVLRAPFAGRTSGAGVAVGAQVQPGQVLLQVTSMDMRLRYAITPDAAPPAVGSDVALIDPVGVAVVAWVSPWVDEAAGVVVVEATLVHHDWTPGTQIWVRP